MAKSKSTAKSKTTRSSNSRRKKNTKAKASNQNLEIIITLALFFGFIIYGAGQCNKAKVAQDYAVQDAPIAQEIRFESETVIPTATQTENQVAPASQTKINLPKLAQKPVLPVGQIQQPGASNSKVTASGKVDTLQKYNKLWVTIDQLKLRNEPNLKSNVLLQLSLFDRVYYLNQKTDFKQEINLGAELANEPWLYIQHENGIKGWVYGAGLNFHKEKRSGVR